MSTQSPASSKSTSRKSKRKKQKVNAKFLAIVASIVVLGGGLVGAFVYLQITRAPARNVALGDELMAQGSYELAMERYGRAVRKRPNEVAYLDKMEEALLKIQPDSQTRSNQLFGQWLQILSQKARASDGGKDAKAWRTYTNLLLSIGETKGLEESADLMAARFPKDDAANQLEARRLKAIVGAMKAMGGQMSESDATKARAEMAAVVDADPSEVRAAGWLMRLDGLATSRALSSGIASRGRSATDLALATVAAAELAQPASPVPPAMRYLIVADAFRFDPSGGSAALDTAAAAVRQSVANAAAGAFDLAQLLPADARTVQEALRRQATSESRESLRSFLERSTGSGGRLASEFEFARAEFAENPEGARQRLQALLDAPRPTVGIDAIALSRTKAEAAELLSKVSLNQYEDVRGKPEATALREDILKQVAAIDALAKDDPSMADVGPSILVALASIEGDSSKVLELGLPLVNRPTLPSAEAAFHVGRAYLLRNEPGQAIQVAERTLRAHEGDFNLSLLRAQALVALGRSGEAASALQQLERIAPNDSRVQALKSNLAQRVATGVGPTDVATDPVVLAINALIELEAKGNRFAAINGARDLLVQAPNERRISLYLAQMLVRDGQRDAALAVVDSLIAADPTSQAELGAARAAIAESDPVKRIDAVLVAQGLSGGELLLRRIPLLQLEVERASLLAAQEPVEATRLELVAKRDAVIKARDEARAALKAAALTSDEALEVRLVSAIDSRDTAEIDAVLAAAAQSPNRLLAGMLRGRRAELAEDWTGAIREYEAIAADPTAPLAASNRLAEVYLMSGRVEQAKGILAESYRRRPGDAETARRYAAILQRLGSQHDALLVLRDAARANPRDTALRSGWLVAEGLYGDKAQALILRRQLLRTSPGDLQNARQLAALLCTVTPSPDVAIDQRGNPRFTSATWQSLNRQQQQAELQRIRSDLLKEAEFLTDRLLQLNPNDFDAVASLAAGLNRSGEIERSAVRLESAAGKAQGDIAARMLLAAAEARATLGDDQAFDRLLGQARARTSQSDRVFDLIAGRLLIQRNQTTQAIEAFRRGADRCLATLQESPGDGSALAGLGSYLTELFAAQARARNIAGMQAVIDEMKSVETAETSASERANRIRREIDLMLVQGDEAFAMGDNAALQESLNRVQALTDEALRLEPGDAGPLLVRSQLGRRAFGRTGNRASLDDALAAVEEAKKIAPGAWLIVSEEVRIRLAREERAQAVAALTQFLKLDPDSMQARERLSGVYRLMGDQAGAIAVWDDAIKADPLRVDFMRAKGDLLSVLDRPAEAGLAYEQAYLLGSRADDLSRSIQGRLLANPIDANAILTLLAGRDAELGNSLLLRSARAAGRYASGLRADATVSLRDIWRQNAAAGAARQPDAYWFLAVNSIFPPENNADLEAFVLDTVGQPSSEVAIGLAQSWLRSPAGAAKGLEWSNKALADTSLPLATRSAIYSLVGQALGYEGKWDEAAAQLEKAVAEFPRNPTALNNLAYIEAKRLNRYDSAIDHSRRAVEFSGTPNAEYLDTLGFALLKSGKLDEAASRLDQAAELSPSSSLVLHQAMIRQAQGRGDEARALGQRAKAVATDDEERSEAEAFLAALAEAPAGTTP